MTLRCVSDGEMSQRSMQAWACGGSNVKTEVATGLGRLIGIQGSHYFICINTHLQAFLVPVDIVSFFLSAPGSLNGSRRTLLLFGMEKGRDAINLIPHVQRSSDNVLETLNSTL